jgi:hypothetical protein
MERWGTSVPSFTIVLRRKMLKDFKPKINVVEKRWAKVLPFTFKLR